MGSRPPVPRRFRLDASKYRHQVLGMMLRQCAVLVPIALAVFAVFGSARPTAIPLLAGSTAVGMALVLLLFGWAMWSQRSAFEVIVSERVLRRNLGAAPPAEVLRSQVTEIIETPSGLWVKSASPSRSVFVWRSLDGYEQLKGRVGTWRPIESVSGLTAFLRNRQEHFRQLPLDVTANSALSTDPSLADELFRVRAVSSEKRS